MNSRDFEDIKEDIALIKHNRDYYSRAKIIEDILDLIESKVVKTCLCDESSIYYDLETDSFLCSKCNLELN